MTQPPLKLPDSGPMTNALPDGRLSATSAVRNSEPIFKCLRAYVPQGGLALELASGTGQHIAALAQAYPAVDWLPSDASETRMQSVKAWQAHYAAKNMRAPIVLNASGEWPKLPALGLIYLVNLFHLISELDAEAVIKGAVNALAKDAHFFIYGPFCTNGAFRSEGDAKFDSSLREQDALIGYKDMEWMQAQLCAAGLAVVAIHQMPANNLVVVAQKTG